MMLTLRVRMLIVCLALAGAAVLVAVAPRHSAVAAGPDARADFAVLKSAPGAGDSTLFATVKRLAADATATGGPVDVAPDPASARTRNPVVFGASGSREVSVTTGATGNVCLASRAGAGAPILMTCAAEAAAATSGLIGISHPAPGPGVDPDITDVTALLPNGVSSVTFDYADRPAETTSVIDNLVAAQLTSPTGMSFSDGGGVRHVDLRVGR